MKSLLPYKVTHSQDWGLGHGHWLEGHYLGYHRCVLHCPPVSSWGISSNHPQWQWLYNTLYWSAFPSLLTSQLFYGSPCSRCFLDLPRKLLTLQALSWGLLPGELKLKPKLRRQKLMVDRRRSQERWTGPLWEKVKSGESEGHLSLRRRYWVLF